MVCSKGEALLPPISGVGDGLRVSTLSLLAELCKGEYWTDGGVSLRDGGVTFRDTWCDALTAD